MKWIPINTNTANDHFELWDNDKKIAQISFNISSKIGRFVSIISRRIFFFEKKGLFTPKAILKNEYGIKIGRLEIGKVGTQAGMLEFDEKKYHYLLVNNELQLFDEVQKNILASCTLPSSIQEEKKLKGNASFLDTKLSSLCLVFCWYAFQSSAIAIK
jgi:hypothetical protein